MNMFGFIEKYITIKLKTKCCEANVSLATVRMCHLVCSSYFYKMCTVVTVFQKWACFCFVKKSDGSWIWLGGALLLLTVWQKWQDEYLTWRPEEYENISTIRIPADALWTPDLVISNLCVCLYTHWCIHSYSITETADNMTYRVAQKVSHYH